MASSNFTCFPMLPTELRLEIWRHALSEPAVCAVMPYAQKDPESADDTWTWTWSFALAYIGPAPYLAGYSCREARQVLQQIHSYVETEVILHGMWQESLFPQIPPSLVTPPIGIWINPASTVIHLSITGNVRAVVAVTGSLHREQLSKFRYVVVPRTGRWSQVWWALKKVLSTCSHLDGVFVEDVHDEQSEPVAAAKYLALSEEAPAGLGEFGRLLKYASWSDVKRCFRDNFGERLPQIYVIDQHGTRRRG